MNLCFNKQFEMMKKKMNFCKESKIYIEYQILGYIIYKILKMSLKVTWLIFNRAKLKYNQIKALLDSVN